ncbi:hypothetical Protein YC6258_03863 [Gynuella sunshinyii YC6258]|uniref:Uncharacterized protein n=1 Tax=Gynuella sunshinyii YC6258 TaxID=1445510 RepID=A0A0C5VZP4_9GAMM|nr:hypothetical Protein YC6258_03863 [Gynuella sunshinyii YC6258]
MSLSAMFPMPVSPEGQNESLEILRTIKTTALFKVLKPICVRVAFSVELNALRDYRLP